MDARLCMLLVLLLHCNFSHSVHIFGTITENITFFYRKLPVARSVRATLVFYISYSQRSMGKTYPSMGLYTTYPKLNIDKSCSYQQFGQLRNENLHPFLRVGRYRTTTCELSGADIVNCRGRVTVQDYIPRNFYLTFGFPCNTPRTNSLHGLRYNISFSNQSNGTSACLDYSMIPGNGTCSRFYKETYLPNLIGEEGLDHYEEYFKQSTFFEALTFLDGTCYQHIWEVTCYIILPKCDPFTKQVIHPCREMCQEAVEGCWKKLKDFLARMGSEFRENHRIWYLDFEPSIEKSNGLIVIIFHLFMTVYLASTNQSHVILHQLSLMVQEY